MRVLGLLLLLLVVVSSSEVKHESSNDITEYIEIVKCFLNQDNLVNDISSLVELIKNGEYDKLLSLAFKLYADGTAAVKECLKKEEISLEGINNMETSRNNNEGIEKEEILVNVLEWIKKFLLDGKIDFPEYELCMIACEKMYIGYQLDMCKSICDLFS